MRWPFVSRRTHEAMVGVLTLVSEQCRRQEKLFFEVQQDYTREIDKLKTAGLKVVGYMYQDATLTSKKLVGVRRDDYDALVKATCPPPGSTFKRPD